MWEVAKHEAGARPTPNGPIDPLTRLVTADEEKPTRTDDRGLSKGYAGHSALALAMLAFCSVSVRAK